MHVRRSYLLLLQAVPPCCRTPAFLNVYSIANTAATTPALISVENFRLREVDAVNAPAPW